LYSFSFDNSIARTAIAQPPVEAKISSAWLFEIRFPLLSKNDFISSPEN
jgi:hypothetical protein